MGWGVRGCAGLEGGDEAAVFALHGDEGGHDGAGAEGGYVASEDSAEEWGGDGFEDLVAEVAADEGGYAFICNWGGCF